MFLADLDILHGPICFGLLRCLLLLATFQQKEGETGKTNLLEANQYYFRPHFLLAGRTHASDDAGRWMGDRGP